MVKLEIKFVYYSGEKKLRIVAKIKEEVIMLNNISIVLGSALLAIGVGSPALGRVNVHSAELVFFGLVMVVAGLYSDHCKDKKSRRY